VYRALLEERITKLNKRKVKFIDDPLYHQDDADVAVVQIVAQQDVMAGDRRAEDSRVPRDIPPYLQDLYRTPLLSPPRERALFLAFNYHKYRFVTARRKLEPEFARARDLDELDAHLRSATEIKNQIVQANLRLVVSVARKHLRPNLSLMELISDGNITLMRAVESFDTHKGNRFSTYATFALMKGFARSVPEMLAGQRQSGGSEDQQRLAELPDSRHHGREDRLTTREEVEHLLSRLDDRERHVVLAHFGLSHDVEDPATYEQVGKRLGLSKQRVRQIEQVALAKLRESVSSVG
jgi:RNA polymerase sigma factor (sigma-70 family)